MKRAILLMVFSALWAVAYSQNIIPAESTDGKWRYYYPDSKGNLSSESKAAFSYGYDEAWKFNSDGVAGVRSDGKWWLIDKTGRAVSAKYDDWSVGGYLSYFDKTRNTTTLEMNWVRNGDKYGWIDKMGREVIPCRYVGAKGSGLPSFNSGGYAAVSVDGKAGVIDQKGQVIVPFVYDDVNWYCFDGGDLAAVKSGAKWGFADKSGNLAIACKYDGVTQFSNGRAGVRTGGKWGFIDSGDNMVVPAIYENIYTRFVDGLTGAKLGGEWGFIDRDGVVKIPFRYEEAQSFIGGLAKIKLNGLWGMIDKSGKEVVPVKYEEVNGTFTNGMMAVKSNGRWGYVDRTGTETILCRFDNAWSFDNDGAAMINITDAKGEKVTKYVDKGGSVYESRAAFTDRQKQLPREAFSPFARQYVEDRINEWQRRGEFEKTADWQRRVTDATRRAKADSLVKEAGRVYIDWLSQQVTLHLSLGAYDPDNEVYMMTDSLFGPLLVAVPIGRAQSFKTSWSKLKQTPSYTIERDHLALASLELKTPGGEAYRYSNRTALNYAAMNINYNFAPIDIDLTGAAGQDKGKQTITTTTFTAGRSDVDVNIPAGGKVNDRTFAVVIANENYQREAKVDFAINDGRTFAEYCTRTLGLPAKNVHYIADATLNNMRAEIGWLCKVAEAYRGEANIIFYYAGHGIPDEASRTAYLLPTDGYGSDAATGYGVADLYAKLGTTGARSATVFLDACFSGSQRGEGMLASARGVGLKVSAGAPQGNTVVFSAAQGSETAYPYREKGHGMFTYFLLRKLQDTGGDVTLKELGDYISTNVQRQSIVANGKSQTPEVTPAAAFAEKWHDIRLK